MTKVNIAKDIREENRRLSEQLKARYAATGLRVIGLLGSPGSGKTTLLEGLLPQLVGKRRVAVIEGDVATENDARRVRELGVNAVQINTNGACHLDVPMVERALESLTLTDYELLFVENVGNLVCPVSFPLGETLRLAVISAAEGEDKPLKYPSAILRTDALVITKTDIAKLTRCDPSRMADYARSINPDVKVFLTGLDENGAFVDRTDETGAALATYLLG